MSSAASLNAAAAIANGQGLSTNPDVLTAISAYQSQPTIQHWPDIFASANLNANVANVVIPVLNTITSVVTRGQFLLDIYPANVAPVVTPTASVDYRVGTVASAAGTIKNQAQGAFAHGMAGFANVFSMCQIHAVSTFDTIASVNMLQNKIYSQSGLGYTGVTDSVTGGVGIHADLLSNVVAGWGTMYDITNINLITDPYVFGQNLLNQGLGTYGNLSGKLESTGLDVTDITKIPKSTTTTTQESSTLTTTTLIGAVDLPILANVTTTTTVTGGSLPVITGIYKTITGSDLATMVSATGFKSSTRQITSLNDLLDFSRVVDAALLPQLSSIGIHNFSEFTTYLNSRIGQNSYRSWAEVTTYLKGIDVPKLNYSTSSATSPVLSSSTVTTLNSITGSGSGPFKNYVLTDFLGACAGIPYTANLTTINTNYKLISTDSVATAMSALNQCLVDVYDYYIATGGDGTDETSPGAGNGASPGVIMSGWVAANVAAVATALNSVESSTAFLACQQAYYYMLDHLALEVAGLRKANALFLSSNFDLLRFGQQIGSLGSQDKTGTESDVVINKLITNDAAGDVIRVVISENNNNKTYANDPNPMMAIVQSQAQNIPLTTYLNQNK
jgi:hypothetical protein